MRTVILAVLDGWGIGPKNETNPIHTAKPETIKYIEEVYPAGTLNSSGVSVGLPWGEEGNCEVGHLTLGSGRVLYQNFLRITKSIEKGEFFNNDALKKAFNNAKQNNSSVHLVGLLSAGNVHASTEHLKALIDMAAQEGIDNLYLQLFTDGVDSPPKSAGGYLKEIQEQIDKSGVGEVSTLVGRYYGMDNTGHWNRTEKAYNALVKNPPKKSIKEALKSAYKKDLSDEYVEPASINPAQIEEGDSIIFFNFEGNSMKQIVYPFLVEEFNEFEARSFKNLHITTMTQYDSSFPVEVAYPPIEVKNSLGEVLSQNNKLQMRVAESVKSDQATYFFNGLKQDSLDGEYRVIIPSLEVGKIDEHPEMRAESITKRVLLSLQDGSFNFILVNYANPDIIAHTGNYQATEKAVEIIDNQINKLLRAALDGDHILVITSDHGNAEVLFDPETGKKETKHDPNPVPFYIVGKEFQKSSLGAPDRLPNIGMLSDVAPTVLDLMNINPPKEMTGNSLLDII